MLNAVPYAIAALGAILVWLGVLRYLGIFTPNAVRAWRELAAMRDLQARRPWYEKILRGSTVTQRAEESLELEKLLAIAAQKGTPFGFLMKSIAEALAVASGLGVAEFLYYHWQGDFILGVGPWICLVIGYAVFMVRLSGLRRAARHAQQNANRSLGDMLMLVAIMTDGRGLQLDDSVRVLSRCVDTDAVENIVDNRGWQRLVKQPYGNTVELYRLISQDYGIPMFGQLSDAAANANVGMPEREIYTRLAKAMYAHRLADARNAAAKAKIWVTLPVAGMLIPLLILLGAPTFSSIINSFGH